MHPVPCRIARIIRNPIVSIISDQLYDYRSNAHGAIHEVPQQLVGLRFTDLFPYFPSEQQPWLGRVQIADVLHGASVDTAPLGLGLAPGAAGRLPFQCCVTRVPGLFLAVTTLNAMFRRPTQCFWCADAIMAGVISADGANIQLNPSSDRVLQQGDSLVMLRPGPVGECPAAVPLAAPPTVDLGERGRQGRQGISEVK